MDLNNDEKLLLTSYLLQILKLVIIIANISYLTGVGWLILCEAIRDFVHDIDVDTEPINSDDWDKNYP